MAGQEGARRIQSIGKWIILIGCTLAGISWFLAANRSAAPAAAFGFFLFMFVPSLFLGGIIWAIGWIIEGFQRPPSGNE